MSDFRFCGGCNQVVEDCECAKTPTRIAFNVNDYVRVKLNDTGRAIHRQIWDDIRARHPKVGPYTPKKEDAEGWSRWQLWNLMQGFGPHITLGGPVPFDTQIEFELAARSTER